MLEIAGGLYHEHCQFPFWHEYYGSGGRAAAALATNTDLVKLHTYVHKEDRPRAESLAKEFGFDIEGIETNQRIVFEYFHSLGRPEIFPFELDIEQNQPLELEAEHILRFGMLEGEARVFGKRVVYDPQSSRHPKPYFQNGSKAEKLAIVCNYSEARSLSNEKKLDAIGFRLLDSGADVVVIKQNVLGCVVYAKNKKMKQVPAYRSDYVAKIGTGDIFSAVFAHLWADQQYDPIESAQIASMAVAEYCSNATTLPLGILKQDLERKWSGKSVVGYFEKIESSQVYLAGPFFTMGQKWMVDEAHDILREFRVNVFSPVHKIGLGVASIVAKADLKAIDQSQILFAVLEEIDAGTIFEIGYAFSKGKKIIVYAGRKFDEHTLTMIIGTDCKIYRDFTTAIYNVFWNLLSQ